MASKKKKGSTLSLYKRSRRTLLRRIDDGNNILSNLDNRFERTLPYSFPQESENSQHSEESFLQNLEQCPVHEETLFQPSEQNALETVALFEPCTKNFFNSSAINTLSPISLKTPLSEIEPPASRSSQCYENLDANSLSKTIGHSLVDTSLYKSFIDRTCEAVTPSTVQECESTLFEKCKSFNSVKAADLTTNEHSDFLLKCIEEISKTENLTKAVTNLEQDGLLGDFVSLVTQLADGMMKPTDITFLSLLDKVRFAGCSSSSQMRYHDITKLFWNIAYKEGNGKVLRFLSGPKHTGKVLSGEVERGHYIPAKASLNFAIPSTKTLNQTMKTGPFKERSINPGIILKNILNLPKNVDYILDSDGKLLKEGLMGKDVGDINLWGFEEKPTSNDILQRLVQCEDALNEVNMDCTVDNLNTLLHNISLLICDMRSARVTQEMRKNRLVKAQEKHPEPSKFQYGMNCYYAGVFKLKTNIKCLLSFVDNILDLLSIFNETTNLVSTEKLRISEHQNCRLLLSPQVMSKKYDLLGTFSFLAKQRSPEWHQLRKRAKVTGSTLYNAIGLRTTTDHRKHYKQFILGQESVFTDDVRAKMQHGTDHEVDGVATILGRILPSFFSSGFNYYEVGAQFLDGKLRPNILEVSADGILRNSTTDTSILVEIKCPAPKDHRFVPIHYQLPVYYATQILAQLAAYEEQTLLYVCISTETQTATILKCYFDQDLWDYLFRIVLDLYDNIIVDLPSTTNVPWKKDALLKLQVYCETHTHFQCEIPLIQGIEDLNLIGNVETSPYHSFNRLHTPRALDTKEHILANIATNLQEALAEAHKCIRRPASEILIFILTNADKRGTLSSSSSTPIAFALKGKSMTSNTMKKMLTYVREICAKYGIRIASECFDGQWHQHIVKTLEGKALTRYGLMKELWFPAMKLKKEIILLEIVSHADPDLAAISVCNGRQLLCNDDPKFQKLFQLPQNIFQYVRLVNYKHAKKDTFVHEDDVHFDDIVKVAQAPDVTFFLEDNRDEVLGANAHNNDGGDETILTSEVNIHNTSFATREKTHAFFEALHFDLCHKSSRYDFWKDINYRNLEEITSNAKDLNKYFHLNELKMFESVLTSITGFKLFTKAMRLKAHKVNAIVRFMNGTGTVDTKHFDVPTLKHVCLKLLNSPSVPKDLLAVVLCSLDFEEEKEMWERSSPVPMKQHFDAASTFPLYYKPEWCEHQKLPIYRFIDPTHILTNLRVICTQRGIDGVCCPEAWIQVCKKCPKLLNSGLITLCLDKQSSAHAKRVFSKEVEVEMISLGFERDAKWVRLVRHFYEAVDSRSIDTPVRIQYLMDMFQFLHSLRNIEYFPPPGMYIHSIPYITFEALMINCSSRIAAYGTFVMETYNHRAISSLASETFFSSLNMACPGFCPSASQIPSIMKDLVYKNSMRLSSSRGFEYSTTNRNTYPLYLEDFAEIHEDNLEYNQTYSYFARHPFDADVPNRRKQNAKKRGWVTHDDRPLVGVQSLRPKRYKIDESKIPPTTRMGISEEDLREQGIL